MLPFAILCPVGPSSHHSYKSLSQVSSHTMSCILSVIGEYCNEGIMTVGYCI